MSKATYDCIRAMVEPATGLPHDKLDRSLADIFPQLGLVRALPATSVAEGAILTASRCTDAECRHSGDFALKLTYLMPAGTWGSYNVASPSIDASRAETLELWVKGTNGGERFEIVLWSDCAASFPDRPASAEITAGASWERHRVPLVDFAPYADVGALCRVSVGFNDAMSGGGTVFLDDVAFVNAGASPVHVPLDEDTSVTNIGLYMASEVAALLLGWEEREGVANRLATTLTSLELLTTWHGFPQTHNHVVSLTPSSGDTCISTVDLGYLAGGLILVRQAVPELASRAGALLAAMDWGWLFDTAAGLPYGCRYPDGTVSEWHYDWLAADSRLAHLVGIGSEGIPSGSWATLRRTTETRRCAAADGQPAHLEPGWAGGGLFMQLLPGLFLAERNGDLGASACAFAQDQRCFAQEIGAPAWGWSATGLPPSGADYCGFGCQRDDVLVPHASILAVDCVGPEVLVANLVALQALGLRPAVLEGTWRRDYGFVASGDWQTGEVATFYLILDQSMAFLSLANHQSEDAIRALFARDPLVEHAHDLLSAQ